MEKSFFITLMFLCGFVIARVQALGSIAGKGAGNFISPSKIIRLTVRDGSSNGTVVYSSACAVTTNPFGLSVDRIRHKLNSEKESLNGSYPFS